MDVKWRYDIEAQTVEAEVDGQQKSWNIKEFSSGSEVKKAIQKWARTVNPAAVVR